MQLHTNNPIAENSDDYLNPLGTRLDNSTNASFLIYLTMLFQDKELKILDLGCSGGAFVKNAFDMGHEAYGLEGSDYSFNKMRAEWRSIPERLFLCDITKPFYLYEHNTENPVKFDVITAFEVVEHLNIEELKEFALNIKNNLAKGGLVILSVANSSSIINGIELHKTIRNKRFWLDFFASQGLYHQEKYLRCFNHQWVRGGRETEKSFHLILSWKPEDAPIISKTSLLDDALYIWFGSTPYRIIKKVLNI